MSCSQVENATPNTAQETVPDKKHIPGFHLSTFEWAKPKKESNPHKFSSVYGDWCNASSTPSIDITAHAAPLGYCFNGK